MKPEIAIFEDLDITCMAARTVAGDVRQRIEFRLAGWGLREIAADVQSVAAELVGNACAVTPRSLIRVRFVRGPAAVVLAVWDSSDLMPQVRPYRELTLADLDLSEENLDRNGGWGLHIVRALSSECGVTLTEPSGKWAWARFSIADGSPSS